MKNFKKKDYEKPLTLLDMNGNLMKERGDLYVYFDI